MNEPTPSVPSQNDVLRKVATIDLGEFGTLDDVATHLSMSNQSGIQTLTVVLNIPPEMSDAEAMDFRARAVAAVNSMGGNMQVNISLSTHNETPKPEPKPELTMKSEPKPKAKAEKKLERTGKTKTLLVGGGTRGQASTSLSKILWYAALAQGTKANFLEAAMKAPSIHQREGIDGIREKIEEGLVRHHTHSGLIVTPNGFELHDNIAQMTPTPNVDRELCSLMEEPDLVIVDARINADSEAFMKLKDTMHFDGALILASGHEHTLKHTEQSLALVKDMKAPILGIVGNHLQPLKGDPKMAADDYFAGIKQMANGEKFDYLGPVRDQKPTQNKEADSIIKKIWPMLVV